MKIENILIEHFSRLKCANFFILFNKNFDDVSSVRVHLRPTEIFVHFDSDRNTTIDLTNLAVRIQINSLSLLIVKNNLISFRINIASSFREEILQNIVDTSSMKQLQLNIKTDSEFMINCENCSGPLSETIQFRRILELPSEHMDSDDWFCHKHETTTPNGHQQTTFKVTHLTPAKNDLLYGNFFALFHRTHIINIQINSQYGMVHCRRCLNHIGEAVNDFALKLWNGNIKVTTNDDNKAPERLFTDSDSLYRNFLLIIDRISYDYQMLGRQTLKLLFEARSPKGTTFLFMQTMARNLEIYQMDKNSQDANRTTMTRVDGIKCLFLCEENTDPALVQFWQRDVNVVCAQISVGMLEATVEHLHQLSQYVPEQFRMNNGFCLSYLSNGISL